MNASISYLTEQIKNIFSLCNILILNELYQRLPGNAVYARFSSNLKECWRFSKNPNRSRVVLAGIPTQGFEQIRACALKRQSEPYGEILKMHCAKTWVLCVDIIKDKAFWALATKHVIAFAHDLRSFRTIRDAYDSGDSIYGLMVAESP
jgi:hypothetical protein